MKKELVEVAIASLATSWADANERAWATVSRPGPTFRPSDIGDWDYVDAQWEAHGAQVRADEAAATEDFWAALRAAPVWLRLSRQWIEEAWKRAFISARHGYYIGHHAMPYVEDIFA